MRIKETKLFHFSELSDEAKETAIQECSEFNVTHDWWDCTYEDAKNVKLQITSFDLDRNRHCEGDFIEYASDTAEKILAEHGKDCETFQTATNFIAESAGLLETIPEKLDDEGYDDNEYDREQAQDELDEEFLKSILEDYSIMLQKECEYLQSEEAIIETIEANEYEFTEDGQLA